MRAFLKITFVVSLFFVAITSCSRKKDKFLNRNYHAVTTEFNTLYNGYLALEKGKENLNSNYFDNYWDILPIERMQITDEVLLATQSKNKDFIVAEEKAVKDIQKHSMNIEGHERNPQIDEAYLLLGKARYFDQRFVPALESFNYILYKYPASDKINQARIWREKTNMRLDNSDLAIKNLKRILYQENLKGQDLADATSILAQAYINTKSLDSAVTQLEIASNATKNNDERGRYRFIQAQLYNALNKKDSANYAFDKVIELNRHTPRIYLINAYLEKIKNFDYTTGDKYALLKHLNKLENYRENRPYLDRIYYQKGQYYLKNNQDSSAITYYNKSLRTGSRDNILMSKNYQILGDMNFDASVYNIAGKYYDSTLTKLRENSKPYRVIKKKRDNLDDVILYEAKAKVNDSLLKLINFSESERLAYFESYTNALKEKAEARAKEEKIKARNNGFATVNNGLGGSNIVRQAGLTSKAAVFYFYNTTTASYGKNEFVKIWGDRKLEDNWRWSTKNNIASIKGNNAASNNTGVDLDSDLYKPSYYISKIPNKIAVIDSITKDNNYAYYQLGLIYKEKFKEYELAKNKFQALLNNTKDQRLILPAKYNLYKIYELLGQNNQALKTKTDIINAYPDSRYASILSHPDLVSEKDNNSPTSLYEATYKLHQQQQYSQVIEASNKYITDFNGQPIVPKFELLKATALGRIKGFKAYKEGIKNVSLTYANTPEGQQAEHIKNNVLPKLEAKTFTKDSLSNNFKIVYRFKNTENKRRLDFKKSLDTILPLAKYYKLTNSTDVYNEDETFVVVHGLKDAKVAKVFYQLFKGEQQAKINEPYFAISSANYKVVQIHKNLNEYLNIETN